MAYDQPPTRASWLAAAATRWRIRDTDELPADTLAAEAGCSALLARLLIIRGVRDGASAQRFLSPSFDDLPDPMLLPDAARAVARLRTAIARHETIWIHGDYDVDGVTAAALYGRLLRRMGAHAHVHVPHRSRDGYDLRTPFLDRARDAGAALVLTADCGTRRVDEIDAARRAGIDVIVTDHHEPGDEVPDAVAVVNPRRGGAADGFADLSGAGVAFRLGEALVAASGLPVASYRRAYADLAAIGTVADVMPLLGQNRVIVEHGLRALRASRKTGIRALLEAAGLRAGDIRASDIAFGIGPRINAAGRMGDAADALELLLTGDEETGRRIATELDCANTARQREQARVLAEVLRSAEEQPSDARCLVLHGEGWHPGVIGIVAGRVVELTGRPAILVSIDTKTGRGRGSGRSVGAFHLHRALTECEDLLSEYGGHALAAGLSIDAGRIAELGERLRRSAALALSEDDLAPVIEADALVDPLSLGPDAVQELDRLEPCGRGNPAPRFVARRQVVREVGRMGRDASHLRIALGDPTGAAYRAVWWRHGDWADRIQTGDRVDICYRPSLDPYNNHVAVRSIIEDMRRCDE
ncbi:MAG TPA: single-stranded-DNA-specific exonuclease RecJ [Chthonomonadales bacterium]|nr:single-stranded-DNA-specific exonuclease RecJ [Chthonomonadales bacterium]